MKSKMIYVDDKKWREFRIKCLQQHTTMTIELDKFLDKFLKGGIK